MGVNISAGGSYVFNLLTVPVRALGIGGDYNGEDTLGVSLELDLILSLTVGVDIDATFNVVLADGASITIDPINTQILFNSVFSGNDLTVSNTLSDR